MTTSPCPDTTASSSPDHEDDECHPCTHCAEEHPVNTLEAGLCPSCCDNPDANSDDD